MKRPLVTRESSIPRGTVLLGAATAITALGNVGFHVMAARGGATFYGGIVALLSFGTVAATAQAGVQYAVARRASLAEPTGRLLLGGFRAALPWLVCVGALSAFAVPIAGYLKLSSAAPVVVAAGYAAALIAFGVPAGVLIGHRRFGAFTVVTAVVVAARFAAASLLGWHQAAGVSAVMATLVSVVVGLMVGLAVASRPGASTAPSADLTAAESESITADGAYGVVLAVALWACWSVPAFAGRHYLGDAAASAFGAAQLIASGFLFIASAFVGALFPVLVRQRRRRDIRIGALGTATVCLVGTAGSVLVGPLLLHHVYGPTYTVSREVFALLGLSATVLALATFVLWVAQALRSHRSYVAGGILVAVVLEVGIAVGWHGAAGLAAGPGLAVAGGALVACACAVVIEQRQPVIVLAEPPAPTVAVLDRGLLRLTAVGMMVHNEAATVEPCLRAVLAAGRGDDRVARIVVVVSGSTDGTEDIVRRVAAIDTRVEVVVEATRTGKANAVNRFLTATDQPILALVGGDTLLGPGSFEALIGPFADMTVGMTGGRIVPTNARTSLADRMVHVLWELHHEVALREPKMGEAVAFRRVFESIDPTSTVDE
ncbi:MAG TPA: glycosyltransferase, partial [Acidimicrobiales bacterium]|nr:glycosyltransferase [Acidimicrobiales bacterium]